MASSAASDSPAAGSLNRGARDAQLGPAAQVLGQRTVDVIGVDRSPRRPLTPDPDPDPTRGGGRLAPDCGRPGRAIEGRHSPRPGRPAHKCSTIQWHCDQLPLTVHH